MDKCHDGGTGQVKGKYGDKIACLDLFAGPGRYEDGTKSTPLVILEKAIASDKLRNRGGISRSTVMREIRRKRLACYRARRTLRFSEEHITKYLEKVEKGVK